MIFAGCSEKDDAIAENPNRPGETPGQPSETPGETPALTIGTTKYTFPAEGGSVQIPFEVNVDWKTSIEYRTEDSGWLTLTPESGEAGNVVLTITAESNSATEQRSAAVHVLYGEQSCELAVDQMKKVENIDVTGKFDPLFAHVLQTGGYIADAAHITTEELKSITWLSVGSRNLTSLQGIEYFTALERLDCSSNLLNLIGCFGMYGIEKFKLQFQSIGIVECFRLYGIGMVELPE